MLTGAFYDKYGNFDNTKFLKLLEEARKMQIKSQLKSGGSSFGKEISLFNKVSKKELRQFINKLSIFINSGIDIKGALSILVKQVKNPFMKKIATEIKNNIDHGIGINETMRQYPKVFDGLTVSLIDVGEKTGKLGKILAELDDNLLESIELKGKVKGAMIYPVILLSLTLLMVVGMMTFIVPKVTESFKKTGTALPGPTQIIVNISDFFIAKWYVIIISIFITIISVKIIGKTYIGKISFAKLFVNMPIFGYVVKQSNIVYFIKSFTILLDSGVLLLDSLKTASTVVPNMLYKKELVRIKNEVEVGLTISKSLGLNLDYEEGVYLNKLFSEEFAYVISTGEETGTLSDSLKKIGGNYNGELKRYIGNMSSMMEPIIIVIVGVLVGSIIIAVMLPFFEMGSIAKKM
ncbi:type II secretion system F family protein [Candidatus Gracilibacteria bacterium]|nr:type II secretion system F family protein [Candidatus Gracilibacteria bacterium]NUJ98373.1 type II secretion system F family protein [Candidatus Gracilibacteria bacterium]